MYADLELEINNRYSLITLIFFIPYVLFQPPATVVLRKVGPRKFLSAIVVFWGATMIVSCFHAAFHTLYSYANENLRDSALPLAGQP